LSSGSANAAPCEQQRQRLQQWAASTHDNSSASTAADFDDDLAHAGSAADEAQWQRQGGAEWMDALQQCQREVSGSLADVAGVE
jgi:hypothetical protein